MTVTVFPCGSAVNESEVSAINHLESQLRNTGSDDEWILLTNLLFSVTHQFQSDEIDMVVIGPSGVRVIEVKHWTSQWVDFHRDLVEQEAEKVTNKARKIGTTLRKLVRDLPRVDGTILSTQAPSEVKKLAGREVRGVRFHTLKQWKEAIGFDGPRVLSPHQVKSLSLSLEPKSAIAVDGSLRRLAGYVNLELQTPKNERFHRVYKGSHPARRDRVVVHLYDLSASNDAKAENKAKREFEALHRLQLCAWAPRILDSYQDAPGYAGEMFFFTIVDPAAPSLADRMNDEGWNTDARLFFARDTVRALIALHEAGSDDDSMVHRNLTPQTILVSHDNSPIFTGFDRTRIPSDVSVVSSSPPATDYPTTVAPEIHAQGLTAADQRSDVYSLCACLTTLFSESGDSLGTDAREILAAGIAPQPNERCQLDKLDKSLSELLGESEPLPITPPARFWSEDQIIPFRDGDYRIVARLGSGGVGTTFKVVEVDRTTREELGTYVAKVAHEEETGQSVLTAYRLARSHLGQHEALSTIFEVAREWAENEFVSLLKWIEGTPLSEFIGLFPLLAEEQQEESSETLAVRWLQLMCEALDVLHRNGLIHGDVSPRNLIVSGSGLVLTDYDFVNKIDTPISAPGTVLYSSPSRQQMQAASPADDLYALAASFFHVFFEKEPFRHGGNLAKDRGLNWDTIDRAEYPILADVLETATHIDSQKRFATASDMLRALKMERTADPDTVDPDSAKNGRSDAFHTNESGELETVKLVQVSPDSHEDDLKQLNPDELSEQHVTWLKWLLQSYPGSRWGNQETRGLDSEFAKDTYVRTPLEESLLAAIRDREIRLVILCGNAGDGKTALLQHLAQELGFGKHSSSERILEGQIRNGPRVRMNLDGSAAWQGNSADQLLDEFLEPFQNGAPTDDIVHLLAVNDGRLLEWLVGVEERRDGETPLTSELYRLLQSETEPRSDSHIRFISLNERSLVGGIPEDRSSISTEFLESLIDQLYGGANTNEVWSPCVSCSARDRCRVIEAGQLFAPEGFPFSAASTVRKRARQRLFESLQAVHLRGETHITVRELRAALVYILFGIHYCDDYHEGNDQPLAHWDRAFAADSPGRQGEVLRELAQFDPAFEAHPQIDRYLLSQPIVDSSRTAPHFYGMQLGSARRRAFFEWSSDDLEQVGGNLDALGLARGRHLSLFRDLPLTKNQEDVDSVTRLCAGIARLEDLPQQALDREGVVPLRITPRTPTETAFWVEKPLSSFRLEADLPLGAAGIERLHRQGSLIYRYRDGQEERLRLGAELFYLLLELADGYQLGDVSTDDTFSNLSIFVQRLVREDESELLAWNPIRDRRVYKVASIISETESGPIQRMELATLEEGEEQ